MGDSVIRSEPAWAEGKVFCRWYSFDTYTRFLRKREEWAQGHASMKHVPLVRDQVCACHDVWLNLQDHGGTHPESFLKDLDRFIHFFETYCYAPSLLQVYEEPYEHNDWGHGNYLEFVFFCVGRLRHAPQTLLV